MKVKTGAAAVATATMAALIGVSAPAHAAVNARSGAADPVRTARPSSSVVAGVYNDNVWGDIACEVAGAGMQEAGEISSWTCVTAGDVIYLVVFYG